MNATPRLHAAFLPILLLATAAPVLAAENTLTAGYLHTGYTGEWGSR